MNDENIPLRGDELPPELQALEAELALLRPRAERLPQDQLLFLAGQASVLGRDPRLGERRRRWVWPAACAAMTALAASLLIVLLFRPERPAVERIVYVPVQAESPPAATGAEHSVPDSRPDSSVLVTQRNSIPMRSSEPGDWPVRPGRAAELQLQLFEHVLTDRSSAQMVPSSASNVADAVNHVLWSASSLNALLDESPPAPSANRRSPSTSESSGAKS